jgi:deoxyhypusine synthase
VQIIFVARRANLEEDLFNLVAHEFFTNACRHYRDLTPQDEQELLDRHMNRVTDTCIPEHEAMRRLEKAMVDVGREAELKGNDIILTSSCIKS